MAAAVETMAYAGEVPWHGLGVKVDSNLTPDEMLVQAGLDWTVSKREIFTYDNADPDKSKDLIMAPNHSLLVRDSDNQVFGPCGPKFIPTLDHVDQSLYQPKTVTLSRSLKSLPTLVI